MLIAGNWKMNGALHEARARVRALAEALAETPPASGCEVLLCPPASLLVPVVEAARGAVPQTALKFGGQDCHAQEKGAYTGGISAAMLADSGADYVIIGHSERRVEGEGGQLLAAKLASAWHAGLTPIYCVGEDEEATQQGRGAERVTCQLEESLAGAEKSLPLMIAYEPVWAIGSGRTPTPADISAMHRHIAEWLAQQGFNPLPLLYGGSVSPANAKEILVLKEVSGVLVGGASLKNDSFLAIIRQALI